MRQFWRSAHRFSRCLILSLAMPPAIMAQVRPAPPSPADPSSYRLVRVARGIHAFVAPDGTTPMVSGNSAVVVRDSGVLVVGFETSLAVAFERAFREVTDGTLSNQH
jgi:hypothetical protein